MGCVVTAQVAAGGEPAAACRGHGVWGGGGGRNVPVLLTPGYGRDDGITVPRAAGLLRVRGGSCGAWGELCQRHSLAVGSPDTTRPRSAARHASHQVQEGTPGSSKQIMFSFKNIFSFQTLSYEDHKLKKVMHVLFLWI